MKRSFVLALVLIGLGSATASYGAESYSYQVKVNSNPAERSFSIQAQFFGLKNARTLFTVTRSFGTVVDLKIIKNLRAFDDQGQRLEIREGVDGSWDLATQGKWIRLQYDIELNPKHHGILIRQPGGLAIPNSFENGITFRPGFCLIRPKDIGSSPKIAVHFEKPKSWEVAGSWSDLTTVPDFSRFLRSYVLVYQKDKFLKSADDAVEIYWDKTPGAGGNVKSEFLARIRALFRAQLTFFKSDPKEGKYIGIVASAAEGGGEAGYRGLLVTYVPSAMKTGKMISNPRDSIVQTLSHEFFHFWDTDSTYKNSDDSSDFPKSKPEEGGDFRWFTEGFTDYFSYYFLVKAGFLSLSEFAEVLEEKAAQHSPLYGLARKSSLLQASREFFKDRESQSLSYSVGALVALKLDLLLKSESNGKKSLLGFLSYFQKNLKVNAGPDSYDAFKKALSAYHAGAAARIAPYIEDVKDVELSEVLEGFGGHDSPTYKFILGSGSTNQEVPICLVNPPARLLQFGLLDQDCIVEVESKKLLSREQLYSYQDKVIPITIERKGKRIHLEVSLMKKAQSHWSFGTSDRVRLIDP